MRLSQRGRLTDERRVSPCWEEGGAQQEGCAAQCRVQQCWQWMLAGGTEDQRGWTVLFSHCILPADVLWGFFYIIASVNVLNAFSSALFSFFPSKLLGFTMLIINGFHNSICRKNQFIL